MRQSQLRGRDRLRGLLTETKQSERQLAHERNRFEVMQGAAPKVVAAPQLFPTPPELAAQLVELARIDAGDRVLEPSAGTGNICRALYYARCSHALVCVEINRELAEGLRDLLSESEAEIHCADFLECNGDLGAFDRVVMNPPFAKGADIKHIEHARRLLKPGGRLVAVCANGPRQRARLMPEASEWIDLPPGSFKESGTDVNAAICVFDK